MILENDKKPAKKNVPEPPDGGFTAWLVVAASFLIHVVADGIAYSIGLYITTISQNLNESKSSTSWIASIMAGMTYGVGPFAGALVNLWGCRAVSICGSFVAGFGFAISYFAQSVTFLYWSIGVVGGLGLGLIYLPAIVCVTCYFEKRRAFATGIAVCGSGFGTFLLAPVIEKLIREFGWRLSLVITGGIILLCFIFSCFFKPLKEESNESEDSSIVPTIVEPVSEEGDVTAPLMSNGTPIVPPKPKSLNLVINETLTMSCSQPALRLVADSTDSLPRADRLTTKRHSLKALTSESALGTVAGRTGGLSPSPHSGVILQRKDIFYSGSLMKLPMDLNGSLAQLDDTDLPLDPDVTSTTAWSEFKQVFKTMMDFAILKDPVFLFFAFSNFFTSIGYNVPYIYIVDHAIGDAKNPTNDITDAGFLLSIVGISNTLSRIVLGYLSDRPGVNRLYLYNSALTICGIATGLCSHSNDIHLLQLYAAIFGITIGVYVSLTSVILVDLLGLEKLTNAFGILLLFQGIATVLGPPIVGKIFDELGSYVVGFWIAGSFLSISGLMLFLIPVIRRRSSKREFDNDGTNHNEHIVIHCPGENGKKVSNNNISKF